MKKFEYKHIRFCYKGQGLTQEIDVLDIDGERWAIEMPSLPEIFSKLGAMGWEMVSHVVNDNGINFHYYNFKREIS